MKIVFHRSQGSVLITSLFVMVIIGIALASYLQLVSSQNLSIMRSMAWNEAVPVSEAGIEDAMAHLNYNITNRLRDNWTLEGTNSVKERTVGSHKYKVTVSAFTDPPVIYSSAYVTHPLTGEYLPQPRTVKATTIGDALFAKGLVVRFDIDLLGFRVTTDSFDSSDPNYSTDGKYDETKNKDNGDIATNSSVLDSFNAWNAKIFGKASTGPGGNVLLGANGIIGDKAWHASGVKGAKPGWIRDDMNVQFPRVRHPFNGTGIIPNTASVSSTVIDGTSYDFVLSGNYIFNGGLSLQNRKMYIQGPTTILIENGPFQMSGNGAIVIGENAVLNIYMAGASTDITGNGNIAIVNKSGRSTALQYWGMDSNTSIKMAGNSEFVGLIYAPEAAMTLSGGGNNVLDFMGACICKTLTMNGHYRFHYDEDLRLRGPRRGYTIVSWNEVGAGGVR